MARELKGFIKCCLTSPPDWFFSVFTLVKRLSSVYFDCHARQNMSGTGQEQLIGQAKVSRPPALPVDLALTYSKLRGSYTMFAVSL